MAAWQNREREQQPDPKPRPRGADGPPRAPRAPRSTDPASRRPTPKREGEREHERAGERPPHQPRDVSAQGTSWEKSAEWYDKIIGAQGSELYQRIVIPGAMELLQPKKDEAILDLGCGQGVFTRALASTGAKVTGLDAAPTLVRRAREYPSPAPIRYVTRDAADLHDLGPFDAISSILALQNMEHLDEVAESAARVLRPGGRMLWVLNHPCFRIPRQTSWGWDAENEVQYRRVDAYSSPHGIPILMHPGQADSEETVSFHKSLAHLMDCGFSAGFALADLEEWHSDKQSQPGPRARAENHARDEFPLFLALLWRRLASK